MPQVPYPITAQSVEDMRLQIWELMRQLFEDRIGGLEIGDVFQDSGDVLTLRITANGGLTKSGNSLLCEVTSTGGLQITTGGLATKLKSGGGLTSDSTGLSVTSGAFVATSLFDANTILKADSDDTPAALTIAEQRIVGRITGGLIDDLTPAQVIDIIESATGADKLDHGGLQGLLDDDHTQYRLEAADHTHQSTGAEAGKIDHGAALDGLSDDDHAQYVLADNARMGTGEYRHTGNVLDDATFNLPAVTNGGWGIMVAGADEERATFSIKSNGTINLIIASSNVVANADTDAKVCIGTSVASPCVIKNRLGGTKAIILNLWYN